ncbi:S1 RNA-binding domain-containing protein [Terrilactibacillus sp. BCM23-1]|uniref:S1 RNA-binding domain-containing protein n=1 Tax=Terrilactibacillus tamarindi TaxID=2599694 RepID=A0A6N8CSV1_9BACI|nr:Tex family protein [Terrilactibacillus tamarindi]MTT33131.1 S1 RNA-binding domain-containing protein [Terrilactibacillus tamarindi]
MVQTKTKDDHIYKTISETLHIAQRQIKQVIQLLNDDNTIPFIARYRKEMTGGLDEVQINAIHDQYRYAMQLSKRKEEVTRLIEEQGKLTDELTHKISAASKLQEIEDIYRPYKQKRRTRATIAKEKGLEPFAHFLLTFPTSPIEEEAGKYLNKDKGVDTLDDVISGGQDIVAEMIADDAQIRAWIRNRTFKEGFIQVSVGKEKEKDEKKIFEMYYDYQEKADRIVPHRILAINRGEKEGILKVNVLAPVDKILAYLEKIVVKQKQSTASGLLNAAAQEAYKRLISPAIERDLRQALTEKADQQAIHIFSENLQSLLLQPPIKGCVVLGVDPAYRTGCKLAVIDATGKVLDISVIYPTPPRSEVEKSKEHILHLIEKYHIKMIAIGNGTASRETEQFIADVLREIKGNDIFYLIVNEAGASVYSASPLAREEFPDLKVEERSAVSIARRLQDPLAELVKIDPKSVGVGQYQHDVSQKDLNASLTFTVETAVNRVGVNVNTASPSLLQYVSGLSKTVANNIVKVRNREGKFVNREQLQSIPRLGQKTYEQCAGFLRVPEGDQPLDNTAIHPESYDDTLTLLRYMGCSLDDIGTDQLKQKFADVSVADLARELEIGEPTLKDIIEALLRPGLDPRDDIQKPLLKTDVLELKDLSKGMQLEGTIRNVVDFGAFVDIGVKQDGLVHISKLSNQFVKHPLDVVHVGQIVTVWVEDVNPETGRIALSMLPPNK